MTDSSLSGKRILFFGPATFNYEKEIVSELEKAGVHVTYRNDKPGNNFLIKVLLRLYPKILWKYSDRVFGRWLAENGPVSCDAVLVIKGEGISPNFLDVLKVKYKDAKFILYLWDSIKNVRSVELKLVKFDALYSFDEGDCKKHAIFKYRPLFFLRRYLDKTPEIGRGCFFIGTLNGDRPAVIGRILSELPDNTFDYWLFVRGNIELKLRRIFDRSMKGLDPARFLRQPMSSQEVSRHFKASAAIIDIEHPNQKGLTMRTFEVLASGKKLVTTNKSILSHEFYDPSRITVIDRENPKIAANFIDAKSRQLPDAFYEKYSLKGWVTDVLQCVAPIDNGLKR